MEIIGSVLVQGFENNLGSTHFIIDGFIPYVITTSLINLNGFLHRLRHEYAKCVAFPMTCLDLADDSVLISLNVRAPPHNSRFMINLVYACIFCEFYGVRFLDILQENTLL